MKEPKYPYHQQRARAALSAEELRLMARAEGASGQGSAPAEAQIYARRAAMELHVEQPITDTELPNWVRAHIQKKTDLDEFLKALHERTLRAPGDEQVRLAEALVNELSFHKEAAPVIKRLVDATTLAQLQGKEKP